MWSFFVCFLWVFSLGKPRPLPYLDKIRLVKGKKIASSLLIFKGVTLYMLSKFEGEHEAVKKVKKF